MRVIGVTGGVGAGKSTVLSYLKRRYQVRIIQADTVGHEVMEPPGSVYKRILLEYGGGILAADGTIDRARLGAAVFSDAEKLRKLNGIVHPAVKEAILRKLRQAEDEKERCVAVEAALFLEENYDAFCDETWYIDAEEELRRARLRQSRGYAEERIDQIFASQKKREEFLLRCGVVIDNNGCVEDTRRQIDRRMKQ